MAMVAQAETNQPLNKQSRPAFDKLSQNMRLALNTQMDALARE